MITKHASHKIRSRIAGTSIASTEGMIPLTRSDVETYLGEVTDELAARILATGATREELAQAALEMEVGTGEEREVAGGRVNQLCRILAEELQDEIWPEP